MRISVGQCCFETISETIKFVTNCFRSFMHREKFNVLAKSPTLLYVHPNVYGFSKK